ncbi:MAG: FHA domain-containing protein [Isosphaeraceae bacterium]
MKAELVPANGDPPIPITRDVTVLGRREFCDVRIDHRGISKRHCILVRTDGLLVVRDLATTNGTKVNGQRIRWAALLPNDKISFGGYRCRIYLGADDALAPSERHRARRPQGRDAAGLAAVAGAVAPTSPLHDLGFAPPSSPEIAPIGPGDLLDDEPTGRRPGLAPLVALIDEDDLIDSGEIIALDD